MPPQLQSIIDAAWDARDGVSQATMGEIRDAVVEALAMLDAGTVRVAEKGADGWVVNQWLKKAVLLSFRLNDNVVIDGGSAGAPAFDKVPSKFAGWDDARFRAAGFRVVPGAVARAGAFIAKGVVLMPDVAAGEIGSGQIVSRSESVGPISESTTYASGSASISTMPYFRGVSALLQSSGLIESGGRATRA